MLNCRDCELQGYSQELCKMHIRSQKHNGEVSCSRKNSRLPKLKKMIKLPGEPAELGVKSIVGVGAGALVLTTGVVLAPVLGAAFLAHSLIFKLSLGVLGGGAGFSSYNQKSA